MAGARVTAHIELELDFEAILNFSPSPKVVISVPDRGVARLLSLINMSSKRPAPTSAHSPSTRLPTQRFQLPPVPFVGLCRG